MLTYQAALTEVLENVRPLESVEVPLAECVGLATAEDIFAEIDLPRYDIAGPDGYAVRAADLAGASPDNPVLLRVTGTTRAGLVPRHLVRPGTALRIMTGSVMPEGADCVVPFENTDEPGNKSGPSLEKRAEVKVFVVATPGANVRRAGSNVTRGALVLPRGSTVGPAQISALGAVGRVCLEVVRRPTVAVISTGDELIGLGRPLAPGKSFDCNSVALAALIRHCGGIPRVLGIARDTEASLKAKIEKAMSADVIVTSGGVSKGDYDLVRLILGRLGRVVLSRIRMGPGASFAFGLLPRGAHEPGVGSLPFFALAGPPVGCLNNFELLVRPALRKMMGFVRVEQPRLRAVAEGSVTDRKPMDFVKWTRLDIAQGKCHMGGNPPRGAGHLSATATANSLTIIPAGDQIRSGDTIEVLPLDWAQ